MPDKTVPPLFIFFALLGVVASVSLCILKVVGEADWPWWYGVCPLAGVFLLLLATFLVMDIAHWASERLRHARSKKRKGD